MTIKLGALSDTYPRMLEAHRTLVGTQGTLEMLGELEEQAVLVGQELEAEFLKLPILLEALMEELEQLFKAILKMLLQVI